MGGAWTQQGADIDGEVDNDLSGTSVSLSADGSTVAIGAYLNAVQIQVYNSLGQSMINQPYYFSGKDHRALPVNIQKLPQGLYFLKASGEGYEASRPFTKF